jgi:Ca2+-binding EF-hand superfamily protein
MRVSISQWLCSVVAVAFVGSLAVAADDKPKKAVDPAKAFAKKDTNGDGSLSLEEFKKGMPEKALSGADKRFSKIDADGNGKLSLDEFKAGMAPKKK